MTHVHFIGIGGSGLSAIARFLLEQGYQISGSDRALSPLAASLRNEGVLVSVGHAAQNVTGADWVVRSSAIPDNNPEVVAALAAGIPVYKRADFLGHLMAPPDKDGIAIAGTRGKTTTTAMLAWTMDQLGADPSFIIGGVSQNFGVNARAGKGRAFIIEADEYDRMFLGLQPRYAVVNNIEHDHPDIYPTPEEFFAAFKAFIKLIPMNGALIVSAEDPGAIKLAAEARKIGKRVINFGICAEDKMESTHKFSIETGDGIVPVRFAEQIAQEWVLAQNVRANKIGGFSFDATTFFQSGSENVREIELSVPGLHNVRNALATLAVISLMGYSLKTAAKALGEFKGTGRRFEVRGQAGGVTVIDDYAHHPTAIRATLEAARARFPSNRIWAVWQPHTYSRTQTLFREFATAFKEADEVIVSEVYAAREPKQAFSAAQIVEVMPHTAAHFIAGLPEISNYLLSHLQPGDVLIVMSAGDADQVSTDVLAHFRKN